MYNMNRLVSTVLVALVVVATVCEAFNMSKKFDVQKKFDVNKKFDVYKRPRNFRTSEAGLRTLAAKNITDLSFHDSEIRR